LNAGLHTFINYGEGSWHVAQRDIIWVRLSKDAVAKGVKIRDIGTLLAHKFKMEFPELIDAIQVTLGHRRAEGPGECFLRHARSMPGGTERIAG